MPWYFRGLHIYIKLINKDQLRWLLNRAHKAHNWGLVLMQEEYNFNSCLSCSALRVVLQMCYLLCSTKGASIVSSHQYRVRSCLLTSRKYKHMIMAWILHLVDTVRFIKLSFSHFRVESFSPSKALLQKLAGILQLSGEADTFKTALRGIVNGNSCLHFRPAGNAISILCKMKWYLVSFIF